VYHPPCTPALFYVGGRRDGSNTHAWVRSAEASPIGGSPARGRARADGAAGAGCGIVLAGSSDNTVVSNRIGTNAAGTSAIANGGDGRKLTGDVDLMVVARGTPGGRFRAGRRESGMTFIWIALFVTCLAGTLYPSVGRATVKLLERLGHQVEFRKARHAVARCT